MRGRGAIIARSNQPEASRLTDAPLVAWVVRVEQLEQLNLSFGLHTERLLALDDFDGHILAGLFIIGTNHLAKGALEKRVTMS